MENKKIIERYIPMVKFLGAVLGKNSEIVLHDITSPENSIIAIENGHISGREIGGPLTDFVLQVIQDKSYTDRNYVTNYKASGKWKTFRSSSFFIKNDKEQIIGVLCINTDTEPYEKVKEIMEQLTFVTQSFDNIAKSESENIQEIRIEEQLYANVEDLLGTLICDAIDSVGIPPQRMSSEEKVDVVKQLEQKGAFQLKGAVSEVSKALDVSEPTIYRYLNKISTKK